MRVEAATKENLQVLIEADGHELLADESRAAGGDGAGPDPYALLLSSLAACKVMTAHLYARRKGWPLASVSLALTTEKVFARDCEDCESDPDARVDIIQTDIAFRGDLTPAQRERLREISDRCPVHRTLTSETKIRSRLVEAV